jgi:hypothetical protein
LRGGGKRTERLRGGGKRTERGREREKDKKERAIERMRLKRGE